MWLQFDRRTTAGTSWDLTELRASDRMGHHTWVLSIMEFKVREIDRKSRQLLMDGGENVITHWPAYNGRNKLRKPDRTEGVQSDGLPHLSTCNYGVQSQEKMTSKSRESMEKVDNWWWMAARMWLEFDRHTMAGASRDLTELRPEGDGYNWGSWGKVIY